MSKANVELVASIVEQWRQGDTAWTEKLDPGFEWDFTAYPLPDVADRGAGLNDFLEFLAEYVGSWAAYQAETGELIDAGESVVTAFRESIRARESEVTMERDLFFVWTLKSGTAIRLGSYRARAEALEAAGLSD
jgi:ketosteroid isomerase-like protein